MQDLRTYLLNGFIYDIFPFKNTSPPLCGRNALRPYFSWAAQNYKKLFKPPSDLTVFWLSW
jgi:hypothetical protein